MAHKIFTWFILACVVVGVMQYLKQAYECDAKGGILVETATGYACLALERK